MSLNFDKLDALSKRLSATEELPAVKPLPENYRMEEVFSEVAANLPDLSEQDQRFVKLAVVEEEIRNGLKEHRSPADLLLTAAYGISIIMNEPSFYTDVRDELTA